MDILQIDWTDDFIHFHFDEFGDPAVVDMHDYRMWLKYEYDLSDYIKSFSEYEPDGCITWVGIDWEEVMETYLNDKFLTLFANAKKISIHEAYN